MNKPAIGLVSEVVRAIDRDDDLDICDVRDMLIGAIGRLDTVEIQPARAADLVREGALSEYVDRSTRDLVDTVLDCLEFNEIEAEDKARLREALGRSTEDDEPRRCPECGALCDIRVQVCECGPSCPLPPVTA